MHRHIRCLFFCSLILLFLAVAGCGDGESSDSSLTSSGTPAGQITSKSSSGVNDPAASPAVSASTGQGSPKKQDKKTSWDNTPKVLTPESPGSDTCGNDSIKIDISNTAEGYVTACYQGSSDKVKFFVITPDEVRYTYDLPSSSDLVTLPLTGGDGTYTLDVREHIKDDLYSNLYKQTIEVTLNDEFRPFLYPNQYTLFSSGSKTVKKASDLAKDAGCGLDVVTSVYDFVISNVTYDTEKAETVQSGYLPDVDETLTSGKGICFDYAALMTAMLRSQGIPTKLEIGYSGEAYHAWISTYLEETGWVNNIINFDGKHWSLMDPTLAANNKASDVKKYVGDGSHYTVKYSR